MRWIRGLPASSNTTEFGTRAARAVFAMFPGEWQVRQIAANTGATAFWRRTIPVPFRDDANEHGPLQRFRIEPDAAR